MKRVPSEEALARAKQKMAERDRHLAQISNNIKNRFMSQCPLHNVYLLWQRDVDFRAYVFFKIDADVLASKNDGMATLIEDAVYEELEKYGRGKRSEIVVAFEYDSDENVSRLYNGDYLARLR